MNSTLADESTFRLALDELNLTLLEGRDGGADVFHFKADVLDALAAALNEPADGALRVDRLHDLKSHVGRGYEGGDETAFLNVS